MKNVKEVKILKIIRKPKEKGFVVTIPKEIAQELGVKGGEKVKVMLDERGRIIYEVIG